MNWRERLKDHYNKAWKGVSAIRLLEKGPVHQLPPDFAVMRFAPHDDRKMWTYATLCMSQPHDEVPLELHLFSPYESDQITELLYVTAHYHRTQATLGQGHSVNFGRPWLEGSACEYGLLSLPYLDGPELEWLNVGKRDIQCLWLLPVALSEVQYKKQHGLDALEGAFESSGLEYLNPMRPPVI